MTRNYVNIVNYCQVCWDWPHGKDNRKEFVYSYKIVYFTRK